MFVVGLMAGTSADGVDAVLVKIRGSGHALTVSLRAFVSCAYPASLQHRLLDAATRGTAADICHLNVVLGEWFARAALRVIRQAGLKPSRVHLIGSHGQTIHHQPNPIEEPGLGAIRSTLQIGEPAVIAERTGITTVADFRPRDMAVGGQGAPLTPYVHYVLLRDATRSRLIVNLGGIANATYLPAGQSLDRVQAFDTGPGNMVIDGLVRRLTKGQAAMDRSGRLAAKGTVSVDLLAWLLAHPYFKRPPPKSTGREDFGDGFVDRLLAARPARGLSLEDLLATCTLLTAITVGSARQWLTGPVDEVIVGGGGVRNRTLMHFLSSVFSPVPVRSLDSLGWDSRAFEAVAFAVLAYQTVRGECANVPSVTGATRPVILGATIPGAPGSLSGFRLAETC
jgi:anhydro-N-acetylmuramic acid kinase